MDRTSPSNSLAVPLAGIGMLLLCGILRSTDLFFRVPMLERFSVLTLIAWEHLINAVLVLPILLPRLGQWRRVTPGDAALLLLVGWGASAGGVLAFTQAFAYLNPALVILLQKLQPLITIGLSVAIGGEVPGRRFWPWAMLAIVCSYLVTFSLTDPYSPAGFEMAIGAGFAILAATFWGGGTAFGKLLLAKYDQGFVLAHRFILGAILTVGLAVTLGDGLRTDVVVESWRPAAATGSGLVAETPFSGIVPVPVPKKPLPMPLWACLFYMAIMPGLLATASFYFGLNRIAASVASIFELAFPMASVLIMWFWFGRPLDGVQIAAAVGLCVAMAQVSRTTVREASSA